MKTMKRMIMTAAALVALSGFAFGAEKATDTTSTSGGGTGTGTCTDCFDP